MKKLKKFHELNKDIDDKGISAYDAVWVVYRNGQTDVDKIYLNKSDAEKIADERTTEYYNHYRKVHKNMTDEEFEKYFGESHKYNKWIVKSLYDVIENIKEFIYDDYASHDDPSY